MGLGSIKSWYVRRKLNEQLRLWQIKVDAERAKLAGEREASMPVWLHTLLVIFAGGALGAAADAIANGFTADEAGFQHLASAALAGGLISIVGWLKQSPLKPGELEAKAKDAVRSDVSAKLLLLALLPLLLIGCASMGGAQVQAAVGVKGPKSADQATVEGLVCRGEIEAASVYVGDRGGSRAEITEALERARKAVSKRPGCCAAEGKCGQ